MKAAKLIALAAVGAASGVLGYAARSPSMPMGNPAERGITRLMFLPANRAWVFFFGDQILQVGDWPRFFETRKEAVRIAKMHGLRVDANGYVSAAYTENPTGYPLSADTLTKGPNAGRVTYRPKLKGQKGRPRYYIEEGEAGTLEMVAQGALGARRGAVGSRASNPVNEEALVNKLKF